jgi:hypothetical protein
MSVFGVSSYMLITMKGRSLVPFARGTGFMVKFENTGFWQNHVVTAAHVAQPHKYSKMYGNPREFKKIGDRHVSSKLHMFHANGNRHARLPLEFAVTTLMKTDVAALRVENEQAIFAQMALDGVAVPEAFEVDTAALGQNEEVIIKGLDVILGENTVEDRLEMTSRDVRGFLKAKYASEQHGTVLLASTEQTITTGMSGAPVVRASNNKVVGVLVATTSAAASECRAATPQPEIDDKDSLLVTVAKQQQWRKENMMEPSIDLSANPMLLQQVEGHGAAFVPIGEFYHALRRTETA